MAAYGKSKCPQLFNCPLLGLFTWTATDLKSECGILPDSGFVWVISVRALFLSELELFLDICIKRSQAFKKKTKKTRFKNFISLLPILWDVRYEDNNHPGSWEVNLSSVYKPCLW